MTDYTNNIFRFRKFPVYKDVRMFRKELKDFSRNNFPMEERYCLTSQLWRSLDSVLLNIAEGSERYTDKDFSHFLNISQTSLNEVAACLDAGLDDKYLTKKDHTYFSNKAENIYKQLRAFSSKVRKDNMKKGDL
jgi:four helix bundle protein